MHHQDAVASLRALLWLSRDYDHGISWSCFQGAWFGGQRCGFALLFRRQRLSALHFNVVLPQAADAAPTRAEIDREIVFVRQELGLQLGTAISDSGANFHWGTAWSRFDPVGFQASSGLQFALHG
ncbi:hypothetical protein [Ideonella sp.]|uniref:hypothetical protein n=1 Tax=Ideonella sp. TaxID=1929293 RepID=UPI0035B41D40